MSKENFQSAMFLALCSLDRVDEMRTSKDCDNITLRKEIEDTLEASKQGKEITIEGEPKKERKVSSYYCGKNHHKGIIP